MDQFFKKLTLECKREQEKLLENKKIQQLDLKYKKQLTKYLLKKLIIRGRTHFVLSDFIKEFVEDELTLFCSWLKCLGLFRTQEAQTIRVRSESTPKLQWLCKHRVMRGEIMTVIERYGKKTHYLY